MYLLNLTARILFRKGKYVPVIDQKKYYNMFTDKCKWKSSSLKGYFILRAFKIIIMVLVILRTIDGYILIFKVTQQLTVGTAAVIIMDRLIIKHLA